MEYAKARLLKKKRFKLPDGSVIEYGKGLMVFVVKTRTQMFIDGYGILTHGPVSEDEIEFINDEEGA